jgi:DNA-directed RNA polymerase subunit M/transcription elongation factor TFIIS
VLAGWALHVAYHANNHGNPEERRMEPTGRRCPKCSSTNYVFRGRKKQVTDHGDVLVTKYRCRACDHEWKEQTPEKATG